MPLRLLIWIGGAVLLMAAATVTPSRAQRVYAGGRHVRWPHHARPHIPRIEITPRFYPYPQLYRRCVERLQLQYRPSGPVFYPLTYCWWVRG